MPRLTPLPTPRDRSGRFVNWSRTETSAPAGWHLPRTEGEVQDAVQRARDHGRRIRVVGAGHSFCRIAAPDDIAMSLDRFQVDPVVDQDQTTVTVPGGMRLRDLSVFLLHQRLALPIVGSIQAQSVAGAIATGTHGSSLVHGNLSSLVKAMRIVAGNGDVVDLDSADPRLDGARVHVGALGVVTSVTMRIREAVALHQTIDQLPITQVPDALADIAGSAEWVKVWWLPHSSHAQVVRYAVTSLPHTRRPSAASRRWVDERIVHRYAFPAMVRLQHRRPAMTAGLNRWLSSRYLGPPSQVGPAGLMLNTPMPLRHRETEAAIPMTETAEAVRHLLGLFRDGRPAVNFPLELRFVRGDDGWLSPAQGADTCQIGAYTTDGPDCDSFFRDFWQVMRPLKARPHWGKELDHGAAEINALYPHVDRFAALRDELDPNRVFGSTFLGQVLGD